MKTLDEVIELSERCTLPYPGDCLNCEYFDDETCYDCRCKIIADAINYLKEYKRDKDELDSTRLAYIDILTDYVALKNFWAESQANPPLTWDELREMDGKPVWATFDNENGTWYIAKVYDDEVVLYEWGQEFGEIISGAWAYTPKRWQAYRKERV